MRIGTLAVCAWLAAAMGAAAPAASAQPVTLIEPGSVWRYFAGPAQPAPDWHAAGFDDSVWPSGPGVLGYGDPFVTTTVPWGPSSTNRWPTTYFRIAFTIPGDPAALETLRMTARWDDGFVAYVNGVEVARRVMPAGAIADSTWASFAHEGDVAENIDLESAIPFLVQGTNVLAVEVHQTAPASSDLAWDADLVHSVPASVTRGPYLQMGGPDAITVRWRTNVATSSRVSYGPIGGPMSGIIDDPALTTEHEVRITGLSPSTGYGYAFGEIGGVLAGGDESHRFVTHPLPGVTAPARVWVIGDAGRANADQAAVRDAYATYTAGRRTDLWLMLGDNAYTNGTDAQYQDAVFDMYPDLLRTSVAWSTRGNHDLVYDGAGNDYYDLFTMPTAAEAGGVPSGSEAYYSFDHGDVHFVCLDSEGSDRTPGGAMIAWLRQDLAATDRNWIVCFWHHPPYTKGSHDSDDDGDSGGRMGDMRRNVLPILDSTGVDLVLTGHSHSYERSFLVNGHYGHSSTLAPSMIVDGGDGRIGSDGPYHKPTPGTAPFEGAVYVVAGSSGRIDGGTLDHPVMIESLDELGSLVLDFDGPRLDARFLSSTGVVRDSFRIVKGSPLGGPDPDVVRAGLTLRRAGAHPAPGAARLEYSLPGAGRARLAVFDAAGRRITVLADGDHSAGAHHGTWAGRNERGAAVAPGVYFAMLEWRGQRRVARIVLER